MGKNEEGGRETSVTVDEGARMYIGLGTLLLIIVVVLLLRRA